MTTSLVADTAMLDVLARDIYRYVLDHFESIRLDDTVQLRAAVKSRAPLLDADQLEVVVVKVAQQLFGLGPLEPLLEDRSITEIMVNGPGAVWVERDGELDLTEIIVESDMLALIIERIIAPLGLRVDRTSPFVDARLPDGSRVHVCVPPLAIDGPYLTIRRFREMPFLLSDFCCRDVAGLLRSLVTQRKSLLVSGGTGSGKTSLLNALASHIPVSERVVTIEDTAELRLPGTHILRLEARPPNAEGVGAVPIRVLVRNALRMRPDRIVIGEVRGAEALDLLQAMNTGHEGSMSTCHANSPADALRRVETLGLMSDLGLPLAVMREHVRSAIDVAIQVKRGTNGRREVVSICQITSSGDEWLVRESQLSEAGRTFVTRST